VDDNDDEDANEKDDIVDQRVRGSERREGGERERENGEKG
jgi:hypothetical protein